MSDDIVIISNNEHFDDALANTVDVGEVLYNAYTPNQTMLLIYFCVYVVCIRFFFFLLAQTVPTLLFNAPWAVRVTEIINKIVNCFHICFPYRNADLWLICCL